MAIKLEGGGGKALVAWPLVNELFFAASLTTYKKNGDRREKTNKNIVFFNHKGCIRNGTS